MRYWTADEQEYVRHNLSRLRVETLARRIGRTPKAVRRWCARNGQYPTMQDWVTSGFAAELTGLSPQRLTALARQKRITARRVPGGRRWLFDADRLPHHKR